MWKLACSQIFAISLFRIEYWRRNSEVKSYEVISGSSLIILIKFSPVDFHSTQEDHFSWKVPSNGSKGQSFR